MEESKVIQMNAEDKEAADKDYSFKLYKPISFEGKMYEEINLSGLADLTVEDMTDADRYLNRTGAFSFSAEMTLEYAIFMASRAMKVPIELFNKMHPKDAIKLKNRIMGFLYGQE